MKIRFQSVVIIAIAVISVFFWAWPQVIIAEERLTDNVPTRYGMAGVWGKTFDPVTDINFVQLSGFIMWDYDRIWHHWAPEPLRFKVEGTVGATTTPETRAIISVEMLALYYLDFISGFKTTPYVEGGIGLAYTDFQVEDPQPPHERQGSRVNFNPLIGIGLEFDTESGSSYFATVRLSHISNSNLHKENRGVNSVVFLIGRFLGKHR
jgi:hypothetical protein